MRESVWDEHRDPDRLLAVVTDYASLRKLRLLACAIVRHAPYHPNGQTLWELLPGCTWFRPGQERSRYKLNCHEAVAVAEGQADSTATPEEWEAAGVVASGATWCAEVDWGEEAFYRMAAARAVETTTEDTATRLIQRLRKFCRYSEPRNGALHPDYGPVVCELVRDILLAPERRKPINAAWLTSAVRDLAAGAYESHRFDGLPILADALEEAGCTDNAMLRHCREHRFHARGCWVLDRVLGRA